MKTLCESIFRDFPRENELFLRSACVWTRSQYFIANFDVTCNATCDNFQLLHCKVASYATAATGRKWNVLVRVLWLVFQEAWRVKLERFRAPDIFITLEFLLVNAVKKLQKFSTLDDKEFIPVPFVGHQQPTQSPLALFPHLAASHQRTRRGEQLNQLYSPSVVFPW